MAAGAFNAVNLPVINHASSLLMARFLLPAVPEDSQAV
jgi:hypothetical protein